MGVLYRNRGEQLNPYFRLLEDLIALMETAQFGAVIADIKAIEGGHGTSLSTPGASNAARQAIQIAARLEQIDPLPGIVSPKPSATTEQLKLS